MENESGYEINFVIPQGPTGPTGPTGTNFLDAYGGIYKNSSSRYNLQNNNPITIMMNNISPNKNITVSYSNIKIISAGIYEINYFCIISVESVATITIGVRTSGQISQTFYTTKNVLANNYSEFSGSAIINLPENTTIELVVFSPTNTYVYFGQEINASLYVKKIDQ